MNITVNHIPRGIRTQPQWLCTVPAPGEKEDPYNAAGARSIAISAINAECAQSVALAHGLRFDGRLIQTTN